MKYEQLALFDMTPMPSVVCSCCKKTTRFPGVTRDMLPGCTYDCACGRVMRIRRDHTTEDLYEAMSKSVAAQYGVEVNPSDWGYIDMGGDR